MQLIVVGVSPHDAPSLAPWQPIRHELIRIRRVSSASEAFFGVLTRHFGPDYSEFLLFENETVGAAEQVGLKLNVIGKIDALELASV